MKILDKLSTYAALIGTVTAIGGGFYAWGEFNNRLSVLEGEPPVNLQPLHSKDKELNAKIDEALLYANEYKVDLIDRIKKVDDKIVPVNLTKVFAEIGKVREQIAMLPEPANLQPLLDSLKELEEYGWELEEDIEELAKQVAIVSKENELQDTMIEEIKLKSNNPLAK
jgi:hypothetical protein|tara:strand:- start:123 stop:626 length:504 start_codon:yes stop_codon:yes gene_type:complete